MHDYMTSIGVKVDKDERPTARPEPPAEKPDDAPEPLQTAKPDPPPSPAQLAETPPEPAPPAPEPETAAAPPSEPPSPPPPEQPASEPPPPETTEPEVASDPPSEPPRPETPRAETPAQPPSPPEPEGAPDPSSEPSRPETANALAEPKPAERSLMDDFLRFVGLGEPAKPAAPQAQLAEAPDAPPIAAEPQSEAPAPSPSAHSDPKPPHPLADDSGAKAQPPEAAPEPPSEPSVPEPTQSVAAKPSLAASEPETAAPPLEAEAAPMPDDAFPPAPAKGPREPASALDGGEKAEPSFLDNVFDLVGLGPDAAPDDANAPAQIAETVEPERLAAPSAPVAAAEPAPALAPPTFAPSKTATAAAEDAFLTTLANLFAAENAKAEANADAPADAGPNPFDPLAVSPNLATERPLPERAPYTPTPEPIPEEEPTTPEPPILETASATPADLAPRRLSPREGAAPRRILDDVALTIGDTFGLGKAPMHAEGDRRRQACASKRGGRSLFCIEPVDWPPAMARAMDVSSIMYTGAKAIVRYEDERATAYHVLFPTESFEAVAAHFERALGPPTDMFMRIVKPLARKRRENPAHVWRSKDTATGMASQLEVRRYDDARGGFPDTSRGVVMLRLDGAEAIFPRLSVVELMVLRGG